METFPQGVTIKQQAPAIANRLVSSIVYFVIERSAVRSASCSGPHRPPCKLEPTDGEYHAQLLGYDYHGDAGQRNSGQFGILCLSEVVEKYRRCTAVPIWMVGQGSMARRLGSWRSLGAPRSSVGLTLAGVAKPTGPPATSTPWGGCATSACAMAGDRDGVLVRRARTMCRARHDQNSKSHRGLPWSACCGCPV